jgi:predicted HTH domain antitoxin
MDIMRVNIQLPDDISAALEEQWDDVPRRSLEAIAVEAYRSGALTEAQVRRLLGLESRFEVHALLKAHHVPLQITAADVEEDLHAHRELGILPSR